MAQFTQPSPHVETAVDRQTVLDLREKFYNASVEEIELVTDGLMILRVRPDDVPRSFAAGQYTSLGLGNWEPRLPNVSPQNVDRARARLGEFDKPCLVRRAYSVSSSIFSDFGHLVRAGEGGLLEFYIALVRNTDKPAELTPRLFGLTEGDRLYVGPRCRGRYTLERITNPNDTVVFLATGCGEAPHNAMIAELMWRKHRGNIISVTCTRYLAELGYMGKHNLLERAFENYRYLTLTTREARNLDPKDPHFVGKRYIQDYFASEDLEDSVGLEFNASNTHFFLCGSPSMIGLPLHTKQTTKRYPKPTGMIELLEKRGFTIDRAEQPGQIHFEKYW